MNDFLILSLEFKVKRRSIVRLIKAIFGSKLKSKKNTGHISLHLK